jgi:hypothetical protein
MLHARHILFSEPSGNPFGPPQSAREKAKTALEQEKAKKILDEIADRSHVKVAENYTVKPPEQQPSQGLPPGFEPPTPDKDEGPAPQAKPSPAKPSQQSKPKPQPK